ncbi:hypothetical protein QNI16_01490 [Cytophagaceae bacterium YF14B1]|uniref:Uncharacterized protein n=1 Tax=Xanthocytophaga flava TaxID=3048013 RepID=A0AAE3QKG5_9BACT|nr:hypothetical protein [Xanthocytophaga flavus]MDJ1479135.1 hypothetical protein [Xanthocytophaga flavus]
MKDIQSYLVFVISFLTLYATNAQSEKCNPAEPTAKYDYIKVSLLDDNGNPVKDTIVGQILRLKNAFKPCREAMYKATYKTAENILISQRLISLLPTGKSWEYGSDRQTEIVITYHSAQFQQKNIQRFYPNRAFAKQMMVTTGETTGISENEQEVWMHPFRANEYHFTEVAPFPDVKLPLEKGKS